MKISATHHRTKDGIIRRNPLKSPSKRFKRTYKGVEVGIEKIGDIYVWLWTNYGSTQERAAAIDHFHKEYHFENWRE